MCQLVGNDFPRWGMGRSAVEAECTIWPFSIPTHTLGAAGWYFGMGLPGKCIGWWIQSLQ